MTTFRTVDFWAPSLYANTIEEVSIAEPGPSRDPIVRHLPIKYGDFSPVGVVKRMVSFNDGVSTEPCERAWFLTCSSC